MIKRPVIFGELLFDCFSDGSKVMGGAPFNVAWHLQGFGIRPLLISRVGDDEPGEWLLSTLSDWGMDIQGIQRDPVAATGAVEVALTNGQPTFDIVPDVAYDFIDSEQAQSAVRHVDAALLYHGSLAVRNQQSNAALMSLCRSGMHRFVDVNLRSPWWQQDSVTKLLQGVQWAKLNDQELVELTQGQSTDRQSLYQAANSLREQLLLQVLIVTCGDQGAFLITANEQLQGQPVLAKNIKDTVGAGDAFSSIFILGVMMDWPLSTMLPRALEFAASICEIRGATIEDRRFYQHFRTAWNI